jgi:hypothetical protein
VPGKQHLAVGQPGQGVEWCAGGRAVVGGAASEAGWLRAGLPGVEAADACWVLTSPQDFDRLRRARGWVARAYRRWLERMLTAALLPGAPPY